MEVEDIWRKFKPGVPLDPELLALARREYAHDEFMKGIIEIWETGGVTAEQFREFLEALEKELEERHAN